MEDSHERTRDMQGQQPQEPDKDAAPDTAAGSPYPAGLEPELEGEALEWARRKERRYTWLVRIQILMLLAIVALVVYFIVTS